MDDNLHSKPALTESQVSTTMENSANYCQLPELSGDRKLVAGVDEVGCGALFGPVVAAAVILPASTLLNLAGSGMKDSKQLTRLRRQKLAQAIKELAIDWSIGYATSAEIDQINILQASLLAMKRAVLKLKVQPDLCLIDGRQALVGLPVSQKSLIKGDERSLEIAAASIVADQSPGVSCCPKRCNGSLMAQL